MKESNGRIIFASKNRYKVLSEDGCEYICSLSGKFGSESQIMPAVGDHVVFMADDRGASIISSVKERRGLISRKASGTDHGEQVIAAHVDYLFIINAMDSSFSKRRIERFLVLAKSGGVEPVVILSKADMCNPIDMAIYLSEAEEVAGGARVIELSSVTGDGIHQVEELLTESATVCMVGLSGAGKSTLVNRLMGEEVRATADVRQYDDRGRHCTTDRHMFRLASGAMLIDSPGIREVGLTSDTAAVEMVFDEINSVASDCFFADCTHTHEPSCAVISAVEAGGISRERYDSYLKLRRESESYKMRTETPQEKKRSDKRLSRLVRSENRRKKKF